MLESEESKKLLKLLREARKKEPDKDIRLVATFGGVAFVAKEDKSQSVLNPS